LSPPCSPSIWYRGTLSPVPGRLQGGADPHFHLINHCWRIQVMISGSLSPRHGAFSGCGWRNGLQYGE
jgi:hypothetical protein